MNYIGSISMPDEYKDYISGFICGFLMGLGTGMLIAHFFVNV